MNNKGFIFLESIITTVILLTSILLVYSTFSSVITSERKRLYYDDPATLYKTIALKDIFNESVNEEKLIKKVSENDYYINLFSIGSDIYDNQATMIEAKKVYNFTYLGYLTINDLYSLKDCINGVNNSGKCKKTLDYLRANDCEELIKYIKTTNINVDEKYKEYSDAPTHILIGMFFQSKDGESQFINGYDDCIRNMVNSSYSGSIDDYYNDDNVSYSMKCENAYHFGWVFLKSDQEEINEINKPLVFTNLIDEIKGKAIAESSVNSATMTKAIILDSNQDYRYIGANPDNYVLFNNELWRIIGIFNENTHGKTGQQLVKLMRKDTLGNFQWDDKGTGVGSSVGPYGSNDWSDSMLMYMLNGSSYLKNGQSIDSNNYISDGTTKFYQLKDGLSYLEGASNVCAFSSYTCSITIPINGINSDSRELIEEVIWKTGAAVGNTDIRLSKEFYDSERGNYSYDNHPTKVLGKIGLIYPSDYGYATIGNATISRSSCLSTRLNTWSLSTTEGCSSGNWIFDPDHTQWTITPYYWTNLKLEYMGTAVGAIQNYSFVTDDGTYFSQSVHPSLYLKSSVGYYKGSGTSTDPYVLAFETMQNVNGGN